MVNSQDNQGASADADRAATASQPSQQAVSGIAGIPSATPGPWQVRTLENFGFNVVHYDGGDKFNILRVAKAGKEADARLIAAAPELLEALTALFADYKSLGDSGDAGFWSLEDQPVGKQALAAIAKALGQ